MKPLVPLIVLAACTSTRELARPTDPRLRTPEHELGIVVPTTERWHERVDPNTSLRLRNTDGAWSDVLHGRDLLVDPAGVWIDRTRPLSELADAIRIEGLQPGVAWQLQVTRPPAAELEHDGESWILRAGGTVQQQWIAAFELAVAALDPLPSIERGEAWRANPTRTPVQADLNTLLTVRAAAPLGTWSIHTHEGWQAPLRGTALAQMLRAGLTRRVGWHWNDVAAIEVENLSGAKTLGGIFGNVALAVALAPLALLGGGLGAAHAATSHSGGGTAGGGGGVPPIGGGGGEVRGDWAPDLAPGDSATAARPLFASGYRRRSLLALAVTLDGMASVRGDLVETGVVANLRVGDFFELGGGTRQAAVNTSSAWSHATTGLFHVGLHLPLDAGQRLAIPLGFEAGAGGAIAHDLRMPWGLRYNSPSERWFVTVSPATPTHVRFHDQRDGHWTFDSGAELGVTF